MSRIAPKKAFQILGVAPTDDFATIRQAWIKLVKENHPDVVGGDLKELTATLTRINDAYDSLRWHSPEKVRIREERKAEAERQQGTAPKASARRRSPPESRNSNHGRSAAGRCQNQSDRAGTDPSPAPDLRTATTCRQMPPDTAAERVGHLWAGLNVDERFQVAQVLCAPKADRPRRKRALATL